MNAPALVAHLSTLDIELSITLTGKLHVEAPAGVLTDELRSAIRAHRAELVAALSVHPSRDPRPDLVDDAHLWADLLEVSYVHGEPDNRAGLHGALLGARCIGARLTVDGDTLRLAAGEDDGAYLEVRERHLRPHRDQLIAVLRMAHRHDPQSPREFEQ